LATAANQTTSQTSASTTDLAATKQPPAGLLQKIKQPVPWLNWGGDGRIRNEYFNNLLTLNPNSRLHEQDYFRFRARPWTSVTPVDDLSFFARLATEPREWLEPAGYSPYKGRTGLDLTEGIFDGLNVQWKNILQRPATITVGRQDTNVKFPVHSTDYRTLDAFGFNGKFAWLTQDKLNDQLNVSFEFLSGDNPNSKNDEMFDVLWGCWPRWSEIGLYSYAAETRIGQEANLIRFGPGWSSTPLKDLDFSAACYAIFAPESVAHTRGQCHFVQRQRQFSRPLYSERFEIQIQRPRQRASLGRMSVSR
jgi:hypothetical protein